MRVFLGVFVVGVLVIVITGLTSERREAFGLGVTSGGPVAELNRGQEVCQGPIRLPDGSSDFDAVNVVLGTYEKPGPAVDLTLNPVGGGPSLARHRLAAGYGDITKVPSHSLPVGHVDTTEPFNVCLRNLGPNRLAVYGNADVSSRTSTARIDGKPANVDLALSFERAEPRSLLSLTGAMLSRASLWHASWVGTWTTVLLALVVLFGVPALLVRALRSTQ